MMTLEAQSLHHIIVSKLGGCMGVKTATNLLRGFFGEIKFTIKLTTLVISINDLVFQV